MVRAWYMDDAIGEQKKPHFTDPPEFVSLDTLKQFGVHYWKIDSANFANCETLANVRKSRNYDYEDQIVCQRSSMANYDEMIAKFFQEHIHSDDETRLVLDGSGYFDVRHPKTDRWIRIEVIKDDMISIPPGLYHRFTLDEKDYISVNRYFCGNPVWIPLNRPQDDHPARTKYLSSLAIPAN